MMEIEGDHLVRGSGGAEEERLREVAPADGRGPREKKPQEPRAGEQRPPCLAACHLSLSPAASCWMLWPGRRNIC
jgi:hypothetical protein